MGKQVQLQLQSSSALLQTLPGPQIKGSESRDAGPWFGTCPQRVPQLEHRVYGSGTSYQQPASRTARFGASMVESKIVTRKCSIHSFTGLKRPACEATAEMRVEKASWVVHKDREAGGDKLPIYSIDVHPDGTRFATGGGGTSTAHRRCLPRFLLAHRPADPRPPPRTPPLLVPCALPPCR